MAKVLKRAAIIAGLLAAATAAALGIFKENPQIPEQRRVEIVEVLKANDNAVKKGQIDVKQLRSTASLLNNLKKQYKLQIPPEYSMIADAAESLQNFDENLDFVDTQIERFNKFFERAGREPSMKYSYDSYSYFSDIARKGGLATQLERAVGSLLKAEEILGRTLQEERDSILKSGKVMIELIRKYAKYRGFNADEPGTGWFMSIQYAKAILARAGIQIE